MSNREEIFTLTTLTEHLNSNYKKKTGGSFSISDVQGYVQRGYLPLYLEDQKVFIKRVELDYVKGVKFYKLVRKFKESGLEE